MTRSKTLALLVSVAALGLGMVCAPAFAQSAATSAASDLDPFEQALAANRVADFARRQNDVPAMIIAARMLMEVPIKDAEPAAPGATPAPFTPDGLLAEAKVMAKGNAELLMQINVAAGGGRGVLSSQFGVGLVRVIKDVSARAMYSFPIKAKSNELLRIGAIGDSNSKMGMRLLDSKGKVVCADLGGAFSPVCQVKPATTADYKVEVMNQGAAPTRAVILSN